jgi:von Willebrand factor type A domain
MQTLDYVSRHPRPRYSPRRLRRLTPLLTSLSLHIGLLICGLAYLCTVRPVYHATGDPQSGVAELTIDAPTSHVYESEGMARLELGSPQIPNPPQTELPITWGLPPTPGPTISVTGGGAGDDGNVGPESRGLAGFGRRPDAAIAPGGDTAPPAILPPIIVDPGWFRHKQSILYLCDASGSMIEKMGTLSRELSQAIFTLRPWQRFNLIFFQDGQPMVFANALAPASAQNKQAAATFLSSITPRGRTDPIPGIRAAFGQRPTVIFLLTDGDFPDNDNVLAEIRRLERSRHIVIHTVAFVGSSNRDVKFLSLLKTIASETGGVFEKVDAEAPH